MVACNHLEVGEDEVAAGLNRALAAFAGLAADSFSPGLDTP
jgi:hypothetical protein